MRQCSLFYYYLELFKLQDRLNTVFQGQATNILAENSQLSDHLGQRCDYVSLESLPTSVSLVEEEEVSVCFSVVVPLNSLQWKWTFEIHNDPTSEQSSAETHHVYSSYQKEKRILIIWLECKNPDIKLYESQNRFQMILYKKKYYCRSQHF